MHSNRQKAWVLALLFGILNAPAHAKSLPPMNIDQSIRRVQVPVISLSPDGHYVAYLTVQGLPQEDCYEVTSRLVATSGTNPPTLLARYRLNPEDIFDANSASIEKTAGQFAWSPGSSDLAYTSHIGSAVELRIRNSRNGSERTLLVSNNNIEIIPTDGGLEFETTQTTPSDSVLGKYPPDFGLLVKDGYRFYQPLSNPKTRASEVLVRWKYSWRTRRVVKLNSSRRSNYRNLPEEWVPSNAAGQLVITNPRDAYASYRDPILSPDGMLAAAVEDSKTKLKSQLGFHRTSRIIVERLDKFPGKPRILVPSEMPRVVYTLLGWSRDSKRIYYAGVGSQHSTVNSVSVDGQIDELYKEASGFAFPTPASEMSRDCQTLVFVRSTNVTPDELVKIDLKSKVSLVLSSPNDGFKQHRLPTVEFLSIECCDNRFYGRLFLPTDDGQGKPYPLVFTNYISTPGFYASVGDEVPILSLTAHGIAVFTMNSSEANILFSTADFSSEIDRVQQPVAAMEWVRQRLSAEGVIDPDRCGLTGLSYGAEIAMYAYWRSNAFRVISVASASWEPMNYVLAGVSYSKYLDVRGFGFPGPQSYSNWKQISAGLNARPNLPPLLLQSSDGEEYFGNVEAWTRLRRAGAPIEWFEYPHEGHVKRSPANKWWVYKRNVDWFCFWLKNEINSDPESSDQYTRWREMRRQLAAISSKEGGK